MSHLKVNLSTINSSEKLELLKAIWKEVQKWSGEMHSICI